MQGGRSTPSFALHFGGEGGRGGITLHSAGSRPVSGRRSKDNDNRPRTKGSDKFQCQLSIYRLWNGAGPFWVEGTLSGGAECQKQGGGRFVARGMFVAKWDFFFREGISKLGTEKFHFLRRGGGS